MTVDGTSYSAITYNGNASRTDFPITWEYLEDSHVVVKKIDTTTTPYTITTLTDGSDYNITGGSVVTTFTPTADENIWIGRSTPSDQQTDFRNLSILDAEDIEDALDKTMLVLQENEDISDYYLRVAETDTQPGELPIASARANKYLAFDAVGEVTAINPTARPDIDGGKYYADAGEADQGANGDGESILDLIGDIGSGHGTIVLQNGGATGTTTYTLDTTIDLSANKKIYFEFEPGAVLARTTGDEEFKVYSPDHIIASPAQTITAIDMIEFTDGGVVYPEWWGAVGDGSTDDYTAIQAAVNSISDTGTGTVAFANREYAVGTTIDLDGIGIALSGDVNGAQSFSDGNGARIIGTHSSGAVVHISEKRCSLNQIYIGADATRNAGAAGSNYGVLIEGPDVSGDSGRPTFCTIAGVTIEDQPSHGLVMIGAVWGGLITQFRIQDNGGHGIYLDNGTLTSRTNDERPAILTFDLGWLVSNGGNGIVIGSDDTDNWGFRIDFKNVDVQGNATDAGVRVEDYQAWIRAENMNISLCAFSSPAADPEGTGGIYLAGGRSVQISNNRFISIDTPAISVNGYATRLSYGIDIDKMWVSNDTDNLDPAVQIGSYVERVNIGSEIYRDVDSVVSGQTALMGKVFCANINADHTINNSTTPEDVTGLAIDVFANEIVHFRAVIAYSGDTTADIKFAFTAPSGTIRWGTAGSIKQDASLTVTNQAQVSSSGSTAVFGASSTVRVIELVGVLKVGSTSGVLQFQAAQNSAVVADTVIEDDSYIEATIYR